MTDATPGGDAKAPSRALFVVLLGVLVLGAIELSSWILLRFVPEPAPVKTALLERGQFANLPPGAQASIQRLQKKAALHPFIGQVMDPAVASHPGAPEALTESQEYGFARSKSEKIFYPPDDDRVVVAIFGGSVASVLGNVGQKALLAELERAERFAGKEIVVVNLGHGGYKQPQQLMALNYFLALGAHLDVAVNLDGFNDVVLAPASLVKQRVFPFYPQNWYYLSRQLDGEERRTAGELTYLRARMQERATAFADSPLRFSPTATLLSRLAARRLARRTAAAERALETAQGETSLSYQTRGPRREYASPAELASDLAEVWGQSSLQMHALCDAFGIEYHHFLQPNQYVASSKTLSAEERRKAYDETHAYAPGAIAGYPLLVDKGAELRARGLSFHDMTQVFADVTDTVYVDKCCHVNWLGNKILAREMGRAIAAARGE